MTLEMTEAQKIVHDFNNEIFLIMSYAEMLDADNSGNVPGLKEIIIAGSNLKKINARLSMLFTKKRLKMVIVHLQL